MKTHFIPCLALLTACAADPYRPTDESKGGPRAGPRPTQELHDTIAAKDRELFAAVFDRCDTKALAGLVADDLEFYHDKGGLTSRTGADFVKSIEGMCERQKAGTDYRARREVVAGTLKVYPIASYGAVEVGEHRFYRLFADKPEKLVEVALFTMLWQKQGDGWKLKRVLSYDHRLVE